MRKGSEDVLSGSGGGEDRIGRENRKEKPEEGGRAKTREAGSGEAQERAREGGRKGLKRSLPCTALGF